MAEVVILVGPSGAGKSTWVSAHVADKRIVCSSDDYHINTETGAYEWKAENARASHHWCFRKFMEALEDTTPGEDGIAILVDNTNTTLDQLAPYVIAAESYGYNPHVVIFLGAGERIFGRNRHRVPDLVVFQMAERVRDLVKSWPPYWPHPTLVPLEPSPLYEGPSKGTPGKNIDTAQE